MSRLGRPARRRDEWASPHERARTRAAQRLDWPLDPDEAAWLDAHLAGCDPCRARAAEHVDIRNQLRALRTVAPSPPRDLWARTAAAIEQESSRRRRQAAPNRRIPVGALSGVLVIAVVLGATLLSNLPRRGVVTPEPSIAAVPASDTVAEATVSATPLAVIAGDVQVVRRDRDGTYGYSRVGVDEVCTEESVGSCPTARDAYATALPFAADPQAIIASPDDDRAVVVGTASGTKANDIFVMQLPDGDATPSPAPASDPPASVEPTASAAPSGTPIATSTPGSSAEPSATVGASAPAASATPSATPAVSVQPSASPTDLGSAPPSELPSALPSDLPSGDTSPTPEAVAIASDLIVVGQTADFSPDGRWFAFTGRPADESAGPDIYVWQVGDQLARPVTTDHRSVFASWAGSRLVGSRPATVAEDGTPVLSQAFFLDPESGTEIALEEHGWRPIVAPDGNRALVFNGSVATSDDGRQITPGGGSLELRTWDQDTGVAPAGTIVMDASDSIFDARWDETGTAFAVWVQDAADPAFGRLSLFFVDPETGAVDQPDNAPRDEPALPGFSIGDGRLAWATPPGQGGEGSRVQIVAWTDDGVGTIETAPGAHAVVVR